MNKKVSDFVQANRASMNKKVSDYVQTNRLAIFKKGCVYLVGIRLFYERGRRKGQLYRMW